MEKGISCLLMGRFLQGYKSMKREISSGQDWEMMIGARARP